MALLVGGGIGTSFVTLWHKANRGHNPVESNQEVIVKTTKTTVEVATTQAGFKFPADHPKRKRDDKTEVYVIDVTYVDPEDADFEVSEDLTKALQAAGVADITKAFKAGLRLAIGKSAKDLYAEESSGGAKGLLAAVGWIATTPFLAEWTAYHVAGQPDKANAYALEKYRSK